MNKKDAISKLQRQINEIRKVNATAKFGPTFSKWQRDTRVALSKIFSGDERPAKEFDGISYHLPIITDSTLESSHDRAYLSGLEQAEAFLESCIREVDDYWADDAPSKEKDMTMANTLRDTNAWKDIEKDFGISKRFFGKKIGFVTNPFKRKIIFRDVQQAYILSSSGFSKPALILAGSVIEELLRIYLESKGVPPPAKTFDSYIRACEASGLLKSAIYRLTDSVRHFRNLVHLEKEDSARATISKATAKGAVASIFTVANDF